MRYWKECYNPYLKEFMANPVQVRLFILPIDFWDLEILEGTGKYIGRFMKVVDST